MLTNEQEHYLSPREVKSLVHTSDSQRQGTRQNVWKTQILRSWMLMPKEKVKEKKAVKEWLVGELPKATQTF